MRFKKLYGLFFSSCWFPVKQLLIDLKLQLAILIAKVFQISLIYFFLNCVVQAFQLNFEFDHNNICWFSNFEEYILRVS